MRFLVNFLFVACFVALAADARCARPNILFVFSDDHAPHAIGAYGGWLAGVDPTPNIDRLAAEGMLFEQSFCTNSLCGPSRAVILTGKHSHLNGFRQNGDRFDPAQWTFPKELRRSGYQTAVVGKWHLGSDPQGFDYWRVLPGQGDYYNPRFRTPDGVVTIEGHCTEVVTDLAEDWLRTGRDDEKPFLLMCQHKAPHRTWMPAAEHLSLWGDEELPEPATLFDDWSDNAGAARQQQMTVAEDLDLYYDLFVDGIDEDEGRESRDKSGRKNLDRMTEDQLRTWKAAFAAENEAFAADPPSGEALVRWELQRYLKNYLRCVRGVDDSVGRLVGLLDELGLADNTIVVYASDQGFYLGDHGWYDKRWMYDESMRMPLIVRWPGVVRPGARCDWLVQNLDYAATFLDAAGVASEEPLQGRSFFPLLREEAPDAWRDALYYHYFEGPPAIHRVAAHYGVRTDDYKLIHFYADNEWELYDLRADPDETNNVYAQTSYSEVKQRLELRLAGLRDQYGDTTDLADEAPVVDLGVAAVGCRCDTGESLRYARRLVGAPCRGVRSLAEPRRRGRCRRTW